MIVGQTNGNVILLDDRLINGNEKMHRHQELIDPKPVQAETFRMDR